LFPLLSILQEAVQCPNPVGDQIMWFKEIKVLKTLLMDNTAKREVGVTHVVVYADLYILALLLLLLDEPSRQAATASIDDTAALFTFYRGMQTEVLATSEAETPELFFVTKPLCPEFHQFFQLHQSLFDLGHSSGTVYQLAMLRIVLLVCYDEREQSNRLPRARRHLQNAMATRIEGFCKDLAACQSPR